jgi:hypothetical protein
MRQSRGSSENLKRSTRPIHVKPQVPLYKMLTRKTAKRIAVLTVIYVISCAALVWRYYPDLSEANLKVVEGVPTIYRGGYGRHPSFTVEVSGIKFSCGVSPLRPTRSCPTRLHQSGVNAIATFLYVQAITDDQVKDQPLGSPVLINLKQAGVTVWPRGDDDFSSQYARQSVIDASFMYVSLVFLLWIFMCSTKKVIHHGSHQ